MSSAGSPELFLDRSLGRRSARTLEAAGWTVHTLEGHHPEDAASVPDAAWAAEGRSRGWVLLSRDRHLRHHPAGPDGPVVLLPEDAAGEALAGLLPALGRLLARGVTGVWAVQRGGRVRRLS